MLHTSIVREYGRLIGNEYKSKKIKNANFPQEKIHIIIFCRREKKFKLNKY